MRHHITLLASLALLGLLLISASAQAAISSTPEATLVADGPVEAIAQSEGTIYLGGAFNEVGPRTGRGVQFNPTLNERDTAIPQVGGIDSVITSVIADGEGGWYIGGRFSEVGGVKRTNLARILANGSVDPNFDPEVEAPYGERDSAAIQSLTLSGSTLYVGGEFAKIGGQSREYLAALDTANGRATAFDPKLDGPVSCGVVVYGSYVFVCGGLGVTTGENEVSRGVGELNASTGEPTSWNPGLYDYPQAMYLAPGGILYLAYEGTLKIQPKVEEFGEEREVEHFGVAALKLAAEPTQTPTVLPFNPHFGSPNAFFSEPQVSSFAQVGSTLYVGGRFEAIEYYGENENHEETYSEEQHLRVAAFNTAENYAVLPFEPAVNNLVTTLQASGEHLYLAGDFSQVGGQTRQGIAEINDKSAAVEGANPEIDGYVNALAVSSSAVYAGGSIVTAGGVARHHLAAIDASTGALEPYDPGVDGSVDALALSGSTLYVGGAFRNATAVGGEEQARGNLAAFSTGSGTISSFAPNPNGQVSALAVADGKLYAGGSFNQIEEKAHGDLAAFSTATGALESFNPEPNGAVNALLVSGERLYAAGSFSKLTGVSETPRNDLAAFELPAGTLDSGFAPPSFNGTLFALAAGNSSVYVGGDYSEVGGAEQPRLAALSTDTGALQSWNPEVNDDVTALLLDGSTLYAGGSFQDAGGLERSGLVGLNTTTAQATHFAPEPDLDVKALALGPNALYVGGDFQDMGGAPQTYFAALPTNGSPEEEESKAEQEKAERERREREGSEGAGGEEQSSGSSSEGSDPGSIPLTSTPTTFITSGPPYYTSSHEAKFEFASDVAGASFQCSLDGAPPTPCSSPDTFTGLSDGTHRFVVQALTGAGMIDSGGASESFVVGEPLVAEPESSGGPQAGASAASATPKLTSVKTVKRLARAAARHQALFTVTVSKAATLTVAVRRLERAKCKKHRSCMRAVLIARLTLHVKAGTTKLRLPKALLERELLPGRYRATIVASGEGGSSKPVTFNFTLTRG